MGNKYLIDSNVVIDFCNGKLPAAAKNLLFSIRPEISIITNIELFATKNISQQEFELLEKFVSISIVYPIDVSLVNACIEIRQNYSIKLPDAIIAATALTHGLILMTRNTKDFATILDLEVLNPHEL